MKLKRGDFALHKCDVGSYMIIADYNPYEVIDEILTNQKLREKIVDLADIWDGEVSWHYGQSLQTILNKLGIKDIPEFYKKENMDKLIKEMKR